MKAFQPHPLPLENLDWSAFVHLIGKANAEVARFDGLVQGMKNPSILLSPLTKQEAVLSSKIEGTQATLLEVMEFEADPKKFTEKYDDIQEVLNYIKAMNIAMENISKIGFTTRLIKIIHKELMQGVRGKNKSPGEFRTGQVHIGKPGRPIDEATYVPPQPNHIADCFSDLEKYFHYDEKDILVQLAIVHAQFEIIHPFWDGNGRTGRIIMPLFLHFKNSIHSPNFYLSEYFEKDREEYYARLQGISSNSDWGAWIEYFLKAVIEQSKINISKAQAILDLYEGKKDKISEIVNSKYAIKALDSIFAFPVFTSSNFSKQAHIPSTTAKKILNKLVKNNVLEILREGSGPKPTGYVFPKLLQITG